MSSRIVRGLLAALFILTLAWSASAADGLLDCLICKDFKRRNCWPEPFTSQDIPTVRAPFVVQVANGWERQNMMGEHYFEASTGALTEAGRLKVQWILLDAPEQHRVVFVRRALADDVTQARVSTIRQYAASIAGPNAAQVVVSNMPEAGRSGDYIDRVHRKFAAAMPEPKLPEAKPIGGEGN